MLHYDSVQELVDQAVAQNTNISDVVLADQAQKAHTQTEMILAKMGEHLRIMREASAKGAVSTETSPSGLSGGAAFKMKQAMDQGKTLCGETLAKVMIKALAVSEQNACMGRIVAAPTAGSCGIIPAVVLTLQEDRSIPDEQAIKSLFTASGFGLVIAENAYISGAKGGCQAECGSAAAMAAAAAVELAGGTPSMAAHAAAIALKNVLGLVCDPVAGLVEAPCIKRNVSGAVNALVSAEMALAGIQSAIPVDEVIAAMKSVGDSMPLSLKETAEGGLAATPTAMRIAKEFFG